MKTSLLFVLTVFLVMACGENHKYGGGGSTNEGNEPVYSHSSSGDCPATLEEDAMSFARLSFRKASEVMGTQDKELAKRVVQEVADACNGLVAKYGASLVCTNRNGGTVRMRDIQSKCDQLQTQINSL